MRSDEGQDDGRIKIGVVGQQTTTHVNRLVPPSSFPPFLDAFIYHHNTLSLELHSECVLPLRRLWGSVGWEACWRESRRQYSRFLGRRVDGREGSRKGRKRDAKSGRDEVKEGGSQKRGT